MKKWFREQYVRLLGRAKSWLEHKLQNENERRFEVLSKRIADNRRFSIQLVQKQCPHISGCLGESWDTFGRTSIVWHQLNTGERVGICTNCFREFFPSDSDYEVWRKRASINKLSVAEQWKSDRKAEPFLMRNIDFPTPIDMPQFQYKEIADSEDDPWLLKEDGTPDEFMLVDFKTAELDEAKEAEAAQ